MKFIIFEQLSCLAHLPHNSQPSQLWIGSFVVIINLQFLALMLPNDGWNLWKYVDGHFLLLKQIAQSFLMVPYFLQGKLYLSSLAFSIAVILLVSFFAIIAILVFFGIRENLNPAKNYKLRKFIFIFIMIITTILQIPILLLLISLIIIDDSGLNSEKTIFNAKSILSLFAILLYSIFTFLQCYFLRACTFVPLYPLQSRFNGLQTFEYIFNVLNCVLYFYPNNSTTIQFVKISILFLHLIVKLTQFKVMRPYILWINQTQFSINVSLFSILILLTINLFTGNNGILYEDQLIFCIMILGSFSYFVGYQYFERSCLNTFEYETNSLSCISYAQEMHQKYLIANESSKSKEFFQLYLYWKAHKIGCFKHWLKPNYKTDFNQIQRTHQTIFCILNTELEKAKFDFKIDYEELQILYINYLAQFCKKPLLAYVELKKYQAKGQLQSFYFLSMKQQMTRYLQSLISQFQNENRQIYLQTKVVQEKQLSISSIYRTLQFQMEFIPAIIEVLSDKINFWSKLIKGFNSIYDLEKLAIQQSQKVNKLTSQFYEYCQFDFNNSEHIQKIDNVQDLKLFSIFCSAIMNDYHNSQICESTIMDVFNFEHTMQDDFISNLTFIQEKAALVMVSLVKNRGKIVNTDKKLIAQLFNFNEQSFQSIDNISELMPQFFAQLHDKLLLNYLQTAKSLFFDDYNQIFGKSSQNLLVSYQLKFDNNFVELDDYVLIGCISQYRKTQDYVLFDESGYLIGVTENFFETIIKTDETKLSLVSEFLRQINIYFLIPNILELLNQVKNNYGKEYQIFQQQDKLYQIWKFQDIKQLYEISSKFTLHSKMSSLKSQKIEKSILASEVSKVSNETDKINKMIYNQLGQSKKLKEKNNSFLSKYQIFDPQFINLVNNAIDKLEIKDKMQYLAKMQLSFKIIGKKNSKRGYFILEISDLKKIDEQLKTIDSLVNNPFTNSTQSKFKININDVSSDFQFNNFEVDKKEEITPNVSKKSGGGFKRILEKMESKQHQYQDQMGQESGRESMSYGPLSQRINFISPSSKQQHLQDLLEQDFADLQNQLENENENEENRADYDLSNSVKMKSNSQEQNSKRNSFIKILQNNKLDKRNGDLDQSINKSKSSLTSGTSGISAITTIKKFQQKKEMIVSLRAIFIINLLVIIILCGYIISHTIVITSYNDQIQQTLANLNGPTLFNRFFFKLFTYTWSLVFNTLQIIESSNFIIQQTMEEMKDLNSVIFVELNKLYDNFINIEEQGMLSYIQMDLLYNPSENVTYTYFINMISSVANTLLQTLNYDVKTLIKLIDRDYCDNLLTLRYNLKNVVNMNFQLIDSLNNVFFSQQELIVQQFQTQVIIEIIAIFIIILFQLYHWKKVEYYCQQILILVGRLQLSQAQNMIIRFSAIIETLKKQSGSQSWKKQNYYQLLFFPLNEIGLDTIQSQSKVLNQHQLSQSSKLSKFYIEKQDSYRQNLNVVLNSKILNTGTTITLALLIVLATFFIILMFLLGGFLIYSSQQNELLPTQELTLSFIKFTSSLDIVVSTALITKSQPPFYDKLVSMKIYTTKEINSFRDQRKIIKIFISLYEIYYQNLTSIYEDILKSNKISKDEEATLLSLFQSDFCDLLSQSIPFCNYANNPNFNQIYGVPDEQDDNRIYLSKGIQGVVSKLDSFFKQSYYYEVNNTEYYPDQTVTKGLLMSQEFTNGIMEHFLDTTDGTNLFIDKLIEAINKITNDNLYLLYAYYLITGVIVLIIYCSFYGCWISRSNERLILLRLILTNLPIEVLTEPHTLTILKKLQ